MKSFNGMELLKLLAESEEKVAKLYFDLAEKVNDEKAKNVFVKLANDELNHQKMYTALMADLDQQLTIELDEDDFDYVDSLIKYNYFRNDAVKASFVKENALLLAERIERDTLLLARELQEMFPDVAKDQMKFVVKEEKKHLKFVLQSQQNQMYKTLML
ncbi:MAG: hypothetical protein JW702_10200 [Clostridiales bacterium]|nr:hypothetical protein [Clostridiales bacterium]